MIKNVDEIVKITLEADKLKAIKRHETTMDYINNTLAQAIVKAAKNGEVDIKVRVSEAVSRELISRVVSAAGYNITIKGYDISICWLNKYITAKAKEKRG